MMQHDCMLVCMCIYMYTDAYIYIYNTYVYITLHYMIYYLSPRETTRPIKWTIKRDITHYFTNKKTV